MTRRLCHAPGRPADLAAINRDNGRQPRQPERNARILELWRRGRASYGDIAHQLGCSRCAVAGVIDRARRIGLLA